jgi:hypothetical protein
MPTHMRLPDELNSSLRSCASSFMAQGTLRRQVLNQRYPQLSISGRSVPEDRAATLPEPSTATVYQPHPALPDRLILLRTVYERHRLWSADGTWERLLQQVQAAADVAGEIDWDVSVDSTVVRTHQHAVGARTEPPPAPTCKGRRTPGRNAVAGPRRPPGGGGSGGEGLGRSRGGFTTKLHLSADGHCRPLSLIVRPLQEPEAVAWFRWR